MFVNLKTGLLLFISLCTLNASATPKNILPIQHWVTKTGTSVLYVFEPELPIVDIQVVFDAGSARDYPMPGIARITNESLSAGTATRNVDQIAASFDDVGAMYSAAVNRDMAVVALRSLSDPKFFRPAFANFLDVITKPNFPANEFSRIQKQTLNALSQQEEQPSSIASKAFYNAVYDDNPYGHPVSGTSAAISKLTAADLQRFYKTYYTAQNALIAIVGNIDQLHAQQLSENLSANLNQGHKLSKLVFKPFKQPISKQHIAFPSAQTHVIIGKQGIERKDPKYFPVTIGNYILGGGSLTSRLFAEVREKRGLAYTVRSQFTALKEPGPFLIELQTRNSEASNAIKVVNSTLQDFISKGPSSTELVSAKKNLTQGFILKLASNAAIIGQLINIGFYDLPLTYLDDYKTSINNVTDQQVKQVFQELVQPDALVTVTVGNGTP